MTDQVNLDSGSFGNGISPDTSAISTSTPSTGFTASEEMVPKSFVNELVHKRTKEVSEAAYAKAMRDADLKYQNQVQSNAQMQQQYIQPQSDSLDESKIDAIAQKAMQKLRQEADELANRQYYEKVSNEFSQKLQAGANKYNDFPETIESLKLGNLIPLVELANIVDNTADVIYDIGKNPYKAAQFMSILRETPHLAPAAMQELSSTIKQNQQALARPQEREPISHIKASTVSMDSGQMTVEDWRNDPLLRG